MAQKKSMTEKDAEQEVWEYAGKISDGDILEMVQKKAKIKGFFKHIPILRQYAAAMNTVFLLLKDYSTGAYREVPWKTVTALAGALLYLISPLDVIPDFIPGFGFVDDAAVIGFVLKAVMDDLAAYRRWRGQTKR